jgi:C4-dicarboxylate-specific signal transduction histidine kinase
MTAIIVSLPPEPWATVVPAALVFPILLWLAARCPPVFAAAGASIVSMTIAWSAIYGLGHFGALATGARVLQTQAIIIVVAFGTTILAALFAERRETEARLAHSKMMLERERANRLMNIDAVTASIVHEVRQPLAAIAANGDAARALLEGPSPNVAESHAAVSDIIIDVRRINDALESTRALFRRFDQVREQIDVNAIAREVLQSVRSELRDHGITAHASLAGEIPLIGGNRNQMHQVLFNLVHNALEAMAATTDRSRELQIRTELRGGAIALAIVDSGPGIHPNRLHDIFDAFETTKPQGMGLGLAICRTIVESHGGQLTASSDGKNGALFQLVLPIKSPFDDAPK